MLRDLVFSCVCNNVKIYSAVIVKVSSSLFAAVARFDAVNCAFLRISWRPECVGVCEVHRAIIKFSNIGEELDEKYMQKRLWNLL